MKTFKICCFIMVSSLFLSCGILRKPQPEFAKTGLTPCQPVEKLYTLSKEKFTYNPIIDTTAIYVASLDVNSEVVPKLYFLLRFSNNGLCYMISSNEKPFTIFDYNSFSKGNFCRYKIDEKNTITIEFYRFNDFVYWFGKVTDDRILFSREKYVSKFGGANIEEYLFYKQKAMITEKLVFPK